MKCKALQPIVLISIFVMVPLVSGQKLTADEIISRHLDSIASAEKRSTFKSSIASGEVRVEYITQKNQSAAGRIVVAAEGTKLFFGMMLNAADYPQEKIIFDGDKSSVAFVRPGVRSVLGNFVESNSVLLSHGLLAGTLASSWTFLNSGASRAKMSTAGTKKVDGREAYGLSYNPKGGSDLDMTVYFEKETFRHVRTEYKRTFSASMGRTIDQSARQSETRLRIVEDFSDFKEFNDLTLPSKYKISYSITGQNGTTEIEWICNFTEFAINAKLDARTFELGN